MQLGLLLLLKVAGQVQAVPEVWTMGSSWLMASRTLQGLHRNHLRLQHRWTLQELQLMLGLTAKPARTPTTRQERTVGTT
jgi:hypothetical protein